MITTRMDRRRKRLERLINISFTSTLGGLVLSFLVVFTVIFALITANNIILGVMFPIVLTVLSITIISGLTYGIAVVVE